MHKEEVTEKEKNNSGFSLIEFSVVLIIAGLITTAALDLLRVSNKQRDNNATKERIETIQNALTEFIGKNGRLPCVASRETMRDASTYQHEIDCDGDAAAPGTIRAEGKDGRKIRIGSVPVRTLNLPDAYYTDPQGNLFTYAVTEALGGQALSKAVLTCSKKDKYYAPESVRADKDGCIPGRYYNSTATMSSRAAIDVIDEFGKSLLAAPGSAAYVLVSTGKDGLGAYNAGGARKSDCAGDKKDVENCDDDAVFVSAPFSPAETKAHFDDVISYQIENDLESKGTEICSKKMKFYSPTVFDADSDGCVPAPEPESMDAIRTDIEKMQNAISILTQSLSAADARMTRIENTLQNITRCNALGQFFDGTACRPPPQP